MDPEAFRAEMRDAVRVQSSRHDAVLEKLGEITSIKEDIHELKKDVQGLLDLKKAGIGFIAAITLTASILVLGLKSWVADLISVVKGN